MASSALSEAMPIDGLQPKDYLDTYEQQRGGFDFDLCMRNSRLMQKLGVSHMQAKKTGTTICGIQLKDCIVLGADTRATEGPIVADKNADKLHYIAKNIYCAGAGTSADLEHTTGLIESQIELLRLATGTQPRVCTVVQRLSTMLFRYQGHVGCALVLGGVDITGPHLYQIYPHGSTDVLPFVTMGSGSLAAMAMLETGYRSDLTVDEGKALVAKAIRAGIFNDLGSGGNVDVCVITKDGATHSRGFETPTPRKYKAKYAPFPNGTTPILKEDIRKFVTVSDGDVVMAN